MKLIYLKEGRHYTAEGLEAYVHNRLTDERKKTESNDGLGKLDPASFDRGFFENLRKSINTEFDKEVVKGKNGIFAFHYVGLYDYVDENGKNLTFFFLPKFLDVVDGDEVGEDEEVKDNKTWEPNESNLASWGTCCDSFEKSGRDILIQAIDRYSKEVSEIVDQVDVSEEKKRESILELAVRFLRDYLEKGLYIVQRRELELNGLGEIDWQTTIDEFQPVIKNGRPYYMDVMTEQAYSDEDHYITRLQKCLVTYWGRKLEELGLSSVLRVNVPMLSEDESDQLGDENFQIAQINRELNVQFVTRSRETLVLMKELIQRTSENKAANYESLYFGVTGVHALWEKACAEVLGSELDKKISECGMGRREDITFRDYMPRPFWEEMVNSEHRSQQKGWQLDFIRTWPDKGQVKNLVILDAKYYSAYWIGKDDKRTICGQPGMPDIAKQMFYQMALEDLTEGKGVEIVNAFLFPVVVEKCEDLHKGDVQKGEFVKLGWKGDKFYPAKKFNSVNLFTVRIPGIPLLEKYANYMVDDVWFKKIVEFAPNKGVSNEHPCLCEGEDMGG